MNAEENVIGAPQWYTDTKNMPSHTGLLRRGNRYFIRRKIPADLIGTIPGKEVKYALGTSDAKEAKRRAAVEWLNIEARFEEERRRKVSPSGPKNEFYELSKSQRWFLVAKWFSNAEERSAKEFEERLGKLDREERFEMADVLKTDACCILGGGGHYSADDCTHILDKLLADEGISLSPNSETYEDLRLLLRKARLEHIRRDLERLDGEPIHPAEAWFRPIAEAAPQHESPFQLQGISSKSKTISTIGELIQKYLTDKKKSGVGDATIRALAIPTRILRDLLGENFSLHNVTRETAETIRDSLRALPKNCSQRFKGKKLDAVLQLTKGNADIPRLDECTASNYLHYISALFDYAVDYGYMDRNPVKGRFLRENFKSKKKKGKKELFTIDELNRIFRAPLYTGSRDDANGYSSEGHGIHHRGRYWVPLLSLFHGFRLNEACQLYTEDIKVIQGVPSILIRESLDGDQTTKKSLKTHSSERTIPIHPEILKLGFLEFVERRRQDTKSPLLFPELHTGANRHPSDAFSKWFARFLKQSLANPTKATFHSFRHMFRDALREADVSTERAEALGGWRSKRSEEAHYGKGVSLSALRAEIEKVRYPGLNLAHLVA